LRFRAPLHAMLNPEFKLAEIPGIWLFYWVNSWIIISLNDFSMLSVEQSSMIKNSKSLCFDSKCCQLLLWYTILYTGIKTDIFRCTILVRIPLEEELISSISRICKPASFLGQLSFFQDLYLTRQPPTEELLLEYIMVHELINNISFPTILIFLLLSTDFQTRWNL
jgi:hypothetical protein